ncbi:MAG: hypothetical protein JNL42_07880 [Anaerolineae bacterium]|nr:hypothetical protein [Anaerolineae bacterium]
MGTCFVIMPFGGQDEAKRRHYLGVYNQIIRAAAIEAGISAQDIKRGDIANTPGSILTDIVQELYTAEIVIADLSEGNPNVFWELGVRHVLAKSGTVTIIDENHNIPFDLGQYRTIKYSTSNLGSISEVVLQIADAIRKRLADVNRSDNAVHDVVPSLPVRFAPSEAGSEIAQLKDRVNLLTKENEKLSAQLSEIDPNRTLAVGDIDPLAMIEEANQIHQQTGQNLLLRLAAAKEAGEEAFINELRVAVKNAYLGVGDFLQIREMCKGMGLEHHQRAVLEIASNRFPHDDHLRLALIDSYDDANSFNLQERGRLMIEDYLGIVHAEGRIKVGNKRHATPEAIRLLYNFYLRLNQYDWVVAVSDALEEMNGPSSLLSRNKAFALGRSGNEKEAKGEFERAIMLDPTDDTAYMMYGDYVDDMGRYEEAYELFEKAYLSDIADGSRLLALANHITLRGCVRIDDCSFRTRVGKPDRIKYAMPLLLHAIEIDGHPIMVNRIINYLVREGALEYAQAISDGRMPRGEFVDSPLNCLLSKIE